MPRRAASASSSHGTASAYRAAVVTNSHTSAAPSSWAARMRLPSSTESTSGASSSARPTGRASDADEPQTRPGPRPAASAARRAGQRRQHPVRAEPAHVQRVVHQHRPPGGRPQHPGRADLARRRSEFTTRRLAGPGRAPDDHEHRGAGVAQARQQVVVELVEDRASGPPEPAAAVARLQREAQVGHLGCAARAARSTSSSCSIAGTASRQVVVERIGAGRRRRTDDEAARSQRGTGGRGASRRQSRRSLRYVTRCGRAASAPSRSTLFSS